MQKSRIEWTDYTINPIKGKCPMDCKDNQGEPYCYARRLYDRFKWDPEIKLDGIGWYFQKLFDVKPAKIFVGSTMELFGEWVPEQYMRILFDHVKMLPLHTFIFLTKRPENLLKFSPFPGNVWVGASATDTNTVYQNSEFLGSVKATVKFLSIEPLLSWESTALSFPPLESLWKWAGISWVICGQQTPASPKTAPKIEWVREIVEAANKAGVPIFLKDNLQELLMTKAWDEDIFWANEKTTLRQESPVFGSPPLATGGD